MLSAFGPTQRDLLLCLQREKSGLSVADLCAKLDVTATAIRQHVTALEDLGFIEKQMRASTGGRPGFKYLLSPKGQNLFPRQYSWFSELMIEAIRQEKGNEGLAAWLGDLGRMVASSLKDQFKDKSDTEKAEILTGLMNSLAYEASMVAMDDSLAGTGIEATNCIYHALAARFPEVCKFDIALIEELTGAQAVQKTCIVRGGNSCRFALKKR